MSCPGTCVRSISQLLVAGSMLYASVMRMAGAKTPSFAELAGAGIRLPYSVAIAVGVALTVLARYHYIGSIG